MGMIFENDTINHHCNKCIMNHLVLLGLKCLMVATSVFRRRTDREREREREVCYLIMLSIAEITGTGSRQMKYMEHCWNDTDTGKLK
jgi:hypothetical protein